MLRLSKIEKSYGVKTVVNSVSLEFQTAKTYALIGPSGCGKTTMLHVIAGITKPTSGRVVLDGVELSKYSESARDRIRADKIGYVFQTFNLLPGFNALENVVLGMTFARGKRDTARARKLLERVGLSHRISHHPSKMSVGEQQRVAVARALANRPKLLLADEPTANVDPQNQQQIVDLIRKTCQEENIALILVTHSREVSDQFERIDLLSDVNQVVARALAKNEAK